VYIVFEVRVPAVDVPDYVAAMHRWSDELFRVCPTTEVCRFVMTLIPVDS
jgi:hypothetical protein